MESCLKLKQKYITFILAFYTHIQPPENYHKHHKQTHNQLKRKEKKKEKEGKCEIKLYIPM